MKKILAVCLMLSPLTTFAALTKPYAVLSPSSSPLIHINGDPNQSLSFIWESGSTKAASTSYQYTIQFDRLNGDFSQPVHTIFKTCCPGNWFQDSTFTADYNFVAMLANNISQQTKGKSMEVGDTVYIKWNVYLSAIGPNATYESKSSSNDLMIGFVRGVLDNELKPFGHKLPTNNSIYTIQGDPSTKLGFAWQSTNCPVNCGPVEYTLMIDTVDADFLFPVKTVTIPNNDSSISLSYFILNDLLENGKIANGSGKNFYWAVFASNGQLSKVSKTYRVTLLNGMLDTEHKPFKLINPNNGAVILLQGPANTILNFRWESTFTPVSNSAKYSLVFDTLGSIPVFDSPLMVYATGKNGTDTSINITYAQLMKSVDSNYGKNWTEVSLVWGALAEVNGNSYYPISPRQVNLKRSYLTGLTESETPAVLLVYPNPASHTLTLHTGEETAEIRLMDSGGKQVRLWSLSGTAEVDIASLSPGFYYLVMNSASGTVTQKLIINR